MFMYGCENRRHSEKYLKEQIYPLMLHKNTSEKFSFDDCKSTLEMIEVRFSDIFFSPAKAVSKSSVRRSPPPAWCSGTWASCAATPWRRPTEEPTWDPGHSRISTRTTMRESEGMHERIFHNFDRRNLPIGEFQVAQKSLIHGI